MTAESTAKLRLAYLGMDLPYLIAEWKQMFSRSTVMKDVWAGVTVALVALPLNLALAVAAGVEPGVGVTTGVIAGIVAALFGGQRVAVTGPAAAMAVVLIEISQTYGIKGVWFVGMIAGILQLLSGALRLGRLISFIPMPVMVGFANAIGVLVFFNALDDFLGLPSKPIAHAGQAAPLAGHPLVPEFIQDVTHLVQRVLMHQEVNALALTLGVVSFAIALLSGRITKAIPGQLMAIVVTTVASLALGFEVPRIVDIASIPNTLPAPHLPEIPWENFDVLLPFAVTVFMLGSIESLLSASVADGMTMSRRHHSDQELMGQGLANLVVPFFGGIPVTGVIARTAVNIRAGACTRLSAIIHSLTLALLIFFLARYAEQIPLAALAAILLLTGIRLIEWDELREIWKASRMEGCVMLVTTLVSVLIDLTAGVMAGLVFTCGLFIRQMSEVKLVAPGSADGSGPLVIDGIPSCKYIRTFLVDGPLFFGAAERFIEAILIVQDLKVLILHMRSVSVMDLTGVETLLSIHHQLERKGAKLVLAELPPQPRQLLERTSAIDTIGKEQIYHSYREALIEHNWKLLETTCHACKDRTIPPQRTDCPVHKIMHDPASPIARLFEIKEKGEPVKPAEGDGAMNRLFPILTPEALPQYLQATPVETLLKSHNMGIVTETSFDRPQLLVGMCIDYRKSLRLPKDFAYVIRREGANMQGAEFAVSIAFLQGIKHMALVAHNDCAMANTRELRDRYISVISDQHGWTPERAARFFDDHVRSREFDNEIDFVLEEARRLTGLFRGLMIVPMVYRVDDERIYMIRDWLNEKKTQMAQTMKLQTIQIDPEKNT